MGVYGSSLRFHHPIPLRRPLVSDSVVNRRDGTLGFVRHHGQDRKMLSSKTNRGARHSILDYVSDGGPVFVSS